MVQIDNEYFTEKQPISLSPKSAFWHPSSKRFGMAMMMCVAIIAQTLVQNTLSLGIVCMVNTTALAAQRNTSAHDPNSDCPDYANVQHQYDGNLLWDSKTQSYLQSALFWGGLVSGLPAGWLADHYSPRLLVFICLILSIIGTVFIPLATEVGAWLVFVCRFIAGIGGQAAIYPVVASLCAKWIPPNERSTVIALYTSGIFVGFCAILWLFITTNSPSKHKKISEQESCYIHSSLRSEGLRRKSEGYAPTNVPWKYLLLSPPLLVCIINSFLGGSVVIIITVYMPSYFKDVTHVDVEKNGIYTALPFMCEIISKMPFALIADWIKTNTKISPNIICKVFNTIGVGMCSVFLLLAAYADCKNTTLPVVYLCLAAFFTSGVVPGFFTSLVCIAPQFTGIVNSISRFFAQLSAVITPLFVGFIVKTGSPSEWRTVFITVSVLLVISATLFLIFGTVDIQPWAVVKLPDIVDIHVKHHDINEADSKIICDKSKCIKEPNFDELTPLLINKRYHGIAPTVAK